MLEITTLDDIAELRENSEMECKLGAGKDGNGELPKDFWESYSAFANSGGGDVLLGLEERKGHFTVGGINNVAKVLDDLWNLVITAVTTYDLLVATNRGTSGREYQQLEAALERLAGTRIKTNLESGGTTVRQGFGLIESWKIVEREKRKRAIRGEWWHAYIPHCIC